MSAQEISQKVLEWMDTLGALASQELPPFIQEVALYGFWSNVVLSVMMMFFSGILGLIIRYLVNEIKKQRNFDTSSMELIILVLSILMGSLLLGSACSLNQMIKAKCCPKLYVIERFIGDK